MTISSTVSKTTLDGNGVQTSWPFAFKVWRAEDLEVLITDDADQTVIDENWSVVLSEIGGTVTYPIVGDPLPPGHRITIKRSMGFLQDVDLVSGTRFDPEVIETALDKAVVERQQLKEKLDRAVTVDVAGSITPDELRDTLIEARREAVDSASVANAAMQTTISAKEAAETAQAGAEAAQAGAEAAQAGAEAARDTAVTKAAEANVDANTASIKASEATASAASALSISGATLWSPSTAYVIGDCAYTAAGATYRSIQNGTNKPPASEPTFWFLMNIPLGETAASAYRGDRGKTAYDHSQSTHAPANAQKNSDITKAEIEAKLTGELTSHSHAVVPGVPPGAILFFPTSSAPTGYLKANGAAVSRTTYSALFTAIGTSCGVGDGTTTFNVPDLRGEFVRGLDDGRGVDSDRALASTQTDQNKSHAHTIGGGDHAHTIVTKGNGTSTGTNISNTEASGDPPTVNKSTASASHTHTVTSEGGAEVRPRNVALLACIKF